MAKPAAIMIVAPNALRVRSAVVRPTSTADRAIGRLRKRSMIPSRRSVAIPTPVVPAASVICMTSTPGRRNRM